MSTQTTPSDGGPSESPTSKPHETLGESVFLTKLIELLDRHGIQYCVIGGQAVNAYAKPVPRHDLDLVVAGDDLGRAADLLSSRFELKRTPHSLSVSSPNSDLRVKVQLDPRYAEFLERAEEAEVLGVTLPVAAKDRSGSHWTRHAKPPSGTRTLTTSRDSSRRTQSSASRFHPR